MKLLIIIITVLTLASCSLQQAHQESALARGDLAAATAVLTQFAEQAEAGELSSEAAPHVRAAMEVMQRANAALADLDTGIQSAESTPDVLEAIGRTAGIHIPQYGGLIMLGLTTIASAWRAVSNRRAARNIASSVQPIISRATAAARRALGDKQSASAKRIIDESQGRTRALPL